MILAMLSSKFNGTYPKSLVTLTVDNSLSDTKCNTFRHEVSLDKKVFTYIENLYLNCVSN